VGYHILFVIDALPGGENIDSQLVEINGVVLADPESPGRPIPIGDDEIYAPFFNQFL
jgi:hypothetical protein